MSDASVRACPRCGADATGTFCSACGGLLAGDPGCGECGASLKPGALYCSECGHAAGERPKKAASARLPWILSGLALASFSVVIALLVQRGSMPREGEMGLTGGIPGQPGGSPGAASSGAAGMPSMEDLASMTPRQAADRLYDRAMSEHEQAMNTGGDLERAEFFVEMGLQAYAAIPPNEVDPDVYFHIGMLHFMTGDSASARSSVDAILDADSDHLLGLLLAGRIAGFVGDAEGAAGFRARVRQLVEDAGGIPDRVEYQAHRQLIERALEQDTP